MGSPRSTATSLFASLILATLTLTVFARNQAAGPEGALHTFFRAVRAGNARAASESALGRPPVVQWAASQVYGAFRGGLGYTVVEIRKEDDARALAVFYYTNRGTAVGPAQLWRLVRHGREWKVDAEWLFMAGGLRFR